MEAVLIGHSFIRRLQHRYIGQQSNILSADTARTFSHVLEISEYYSKIYTICDRFNTQKDFNKVLDELQTLTKDKGGNVNLVLLEIGSNDLAHLIRPDVNFCLKLASQITELAIQIRKQFAKAVIVHGEVPRTKRLSSSPLVFTKNLNFYNHYLEQFLATEERIQYVKLKGFYCADSTLVHSTVPKWSFDGIHCNTPQGFQLYKKRLRHSLIHYHRIGSQ